MNAENLPAGTGRTPRQRRLLQAMGLGAWSREPAAAAEEVAAAEPMQRAASASATPSAQVPPARTATPVPAVSRPPGAADGAAASAKAAESAAAADLPISPVDQAAVASMDWPALRQAVAGCRACELCQTRTQTVFGTGDTQAQWLVVGEGPGEQEDLQGEPFVGPSGELLDRMLAALQLTRADRADPSVAQAAETAGAEAVPAERRVYIANTVKCRPPRNRTPTPQEQAACEPFLRRQIELLQPRIILALGVPAARVLLRSDQPMGRMRGQVHQYQGVPVLATYHPAYLLRQPSEKAKAWQDLCLAADTFEAAGPATSAKPR